MSTTLTPSAARGTVTVPTGTDRVNIADLTTTAMQAVLNRAEWASKSLIDVQTAFATQSDLDMTSGSFADLTYAVSSLTFTDVSVGDIIVLDCTATWESPPGFTADGTDPVVQMRWLAGAADATITTASTYPGIQWGSTAVAADQRTLSFRSVHTATAAGSLVCKPQAKGTASHTVFMPYIQILGVHFRLGAA
jgi:hypothetical protein